MTPAIVYLYILLDRGGSTQFHRTPHPSYASCFASLDHVKIAQQGADEVVVAWCGADGQRHYGANWWHDEEGKR